jgi:hypothetical protein
MTIFADDIFPSIPGNFFGLFVEEKNTAVQVVGDDAILHIVQNPFQIFRLDNMLSMVRAFIFAQYAIGKQRCRVSKRSPPTFGQPVISGVKITPIVEMFNQNGMA